jgi:hypothetical protein
MTITRALLLLACTLMHGATSYGEDSARSPQEWMQYFREGWDENLWEQGNGRQAEGYMRTVEDAGWKRRMLAFQGCVQQAAAALPILLDTLRNGSAPERILAAQSIGYLGPGVPVDELVSALMTESDAAVRLYLVDSIGMLGKASAVDWEDYAAGESNRDILTHILYLKERGDSTMDAKVADALRDWDPNRIAQPLSARWLRISC